jgi:hypothetical protein
MQMEGIIRDVGPASPFSRASIADPITLAGHPDSLPLLLDRFLTRQGHRPSLAVTDEVPSRHGVLHGQSLGYDSLPNSTKSFAALFAAIEIARSTRSGVSGRDTGLSMWTSWSSVLDCRSRSIQARNQLAGCAVLLRHNM